MFAHHNHSCQIYHLHRSQCHKLVIPLNTGGFHRNHEESAGACGGEDEVLSVFLIATLFVF